MAVSHRTKIAHLKKSDRRLKIIIEGIKLRELAGRADASGYFEAIVEAIVSQQLSIKAADTIFARFAALTPGRTFPKPREIIKIPVAKMRTCGLSKMKVSFIKDLARKTLDGSLNFKTIGTLSDEEVIEHLTSVKGIGRWTAEMFLMFCLNRPDVFSHGDLGLKNAIKKLYKLDNDLHSKKYHHLVESWSPHRTIAARYLWASLNIK